MMGVGSLRRGGSVVFQHLIDVDELRRWMDDGRRLVIADCRYELGNPEAGRRRYLEDHLPGAVYFDLGKDLAGPKGDHGGRHPLPAPDVLAEKLGSAGIDDATWVVAYDDDGAMAARFWWLLRYMGHDRVKVLDGGYPAWKAKGYPTTTDVPAPERRRFTPRLRSDWLVDVHTVARKLHDPDVLLLDSREWKRYTGEVEPIDKVAGHIPGARSYFWKDNFREDGRLRPPEELLDRFLQVRGARPPKEVIVYCGSGVTACPNILALMEAGVQNVKLYAGSWSDWSSYPDLPVATGEE